MRRIPRPSRAIDPSTALHSSLRQRIWPSPCRSAVAPSTHLRPSIAAFSTTSANAFLLPGKQDKKKHQQFVRRWQKRLLGDSEPIGAHVDPYDPTSPVRIAPEEQGEYEEIFEEEVQRKHGQTEALYEYRPAEQLHPRNSAAKLMHVGGEEWLDQKRESDMAKEFEKLTGRTYTPMTMNMVGEINSLTGSLYNMRGGRPLTHKMRTAVHAVTGRPYTDYDFGLHRKITKRKDLPTRFVQAVAEVYTLNEAGMDLNLSSLPNRGVHSPYRSPSWVRDIKLRTTKSGELALAYPEHTSAKKIIQIIQAASDWEPAQEFEEEAVLIDEGDVLADQAADLLEPVLPQESMSTMDPATPAFKRAAVVKIDPEKKPFDFMSNRPVPRAIPAETQQAVEVFEVEAPTAGSLPPAPSRITELMIAFEKSRSAVNEMRHSVLEHKAQRLANDIADLRRAVRQSTFSFMAGAKEMQWRHVSIIDPVVKFALFKRLFQLTGIHISDPQLSASKTLGDLYSHLCAAAKPQPTSLYSAIHIEGQKARTRAKQQIPTSRALRSKADLGDLIRLGNVEIRRTKPTKTEKRTATGMNKVLSYALWERGLASDRTRTKSRRQGPSIAKVTRLVPEFEKPLPSKAVSLLAKRTRLLEEE